MAGDLKSQFGKLTFSLRSLFVLWSVLIVGICAIVLVLKNEVNCIRELRQAGVTVVVNNEGGGLHGAMLRMVASGDDVGPVMEIYCNHLHISDDLANAVSRLRSVCFLDISECSWSHRAIELISHQNIKHLKASYTGIDDADCALLAKITTLEMLELRGTRITDRCIADLVELHNLRALDIGETQITLTGLHSLRGLNHLERLELPATISLSEENSCWSHFPAIKVMGQ